MNNALEAKLVKRLKHALALNQPQINADTMRSILSILIDVRNLLELVGETDRYKNLKFHCDWILHPILTNARVQQIIKAVDAECVKSMIRAGLQEWPETIGSDFIGPLPQEFTTQLLNRFTFHPFELDLREFLERHDITPLPDLSHGTYRAFEMVYCQLIEDRTWEHTNKKHPPAYVNRVRVQMQHRDGTNSTLADADSFPYLLAWVFLWNDEERIKFTVEFLVR